MPSIRADKFAGSSNLSSFSDSPGRLWPRSTRILVPAVDCISVMHPPI